MKKIGGFFELEKNSIFSRVKTDSMFNNWLDERDHFSFSNARSAILALLHAFNAKKLWLPEIFCDIFSNQINTSFYLLNKSSFIPDFEFLKNHVKTNEIVVVPDYFGIEPSVEFINFTAEQNQIHWVQDATHNLKPRQYWGDFTIFSPRKLVGVLDGGILVQNNLDKKLNTDSRPRIQKSKREIAVAPILRRIDSANIGLKTWFKLYQLEENNINLNYNEYREMTNWQLKRIGINYLIETRTKNYRILNDALNAIKVKELEFGENVSPFGFPIYINDRDEVQKKLSRDGIYAAVHWRTSTPPATKRQEMHGNMQLTLPCDQRYNEQDMLRVVKAIKKYVAL